MKENRKITKPRLDPSSPSNHEPGVSTDILAPSPLIGDAWTLERREQLALAHLEAAWLAGDKEASRLYLQHIRWVREMNEGKPVQKSEMQISGQITVVDNLGTGARAALPAGTQTLLTDGEDDPAD